MSSSIVSLVGVAMLASKSAPTTIAQAYVCSQYCLIKQTPTSPVTWVPTPSPRHVT